MRIDDLFTVHFAKVRDDLVALTTMATAFCSGQFFPFLGTGIDLDLLLHVEYNDEGFALFHKKVVEMIQRLLTIDHLQKRRVE